MRKIGLFILLLIGAGLFLSVLYAPQVQSGRLVKAGQSLLRTSNIKDFQSQRKVFEETAREELNGDLYLQSVDETGKLIKVLDENISRGRAGFSIPAEMQINFLTQISIFEQRSGQDSVYSRHWFRSTALALLLLFSVLCFLAGHWIDQKALASIEDLPPIVPRTSLSEALRSIALLYRREKETAENLSSAALMLALKFNRFRTEARLSSQRSGWEQGITGKFNSTNNSGANTAGPGAEAEREILVESIELPTRIQNEPALVNEGAPLVPLPAASFSWPGDFPEVRPNPGEGETTSRSWVDEGPVEPAEVGGETSLLEEAIFQQEQVKIDDSRTVEAIQPVRIETEIPGPPANVFFQAFNNRRGDISKLVGRAEFNTLDVLRGFPTTMIIQIKPNPEDVDRIIHISGVSRAQVAFDRIFSSLISGIMVLPHNIAFEDGVIYWYVPKGVANVDKFNFDEAKNLILAEVNEVDFSQGDPIFPDMEIEISIFAK